MADNTDYKQMAERLLPAAERGNPKAQYNLGVLYNSGKGVAKDFQQAFKWYKKAAEQGHMKAQYYCALLLYKGRGTAKNDGEAAMWLHKSAEQGNEDAKKALEKLLSVPDISIDELISGARKVSRQTPSQPPQSPPQEERVAVPSAENENMGKYINIAGIGFVIIVLFVIVLLFGVNSSKSVAKRERVTEDNSRSYAQSPSSRNDNTDTAPQTSYRGTNLEELYNMGIKCLDEKDYAQALSYFRRAADQNYAPAQDKLGWMYQNGWGVPQNYTRAVEWFRKSAAQGNVEALTSMGLMYLKGWGVPQNYDTAMEWYRRAAAQGSEVARRRMNSIQLLKINKGKIASIERSTGFPVPGTIFAETLSVRQYPNTNSKRTKTLKTGHPVSISRAVDSDNDYWFYVKTASGTEGWVLGGYVNLIDRDLSYQENSNRRISLPAEGYVSTREDNLNLRNLPTVKGSQVVDKLYSVTSLTAYEKFA